MGEKLCVWNTFMTPAAAVMLAWSIAGCATPDELRAKPAALELASNRSAKDVALCIADAWSNSTLGGRALDVAMRATPTGYTIAWLPGPQAVTSAFADVDEAPAGSRSRLYESWPQSAAQRNSHYAQPAQDGYAEVFEKTVQDCQTMVKAPGR